MNRRDVLFGLNSWLALAALGGLEGLTLTPAFAAGIGEPKRYFVLIRMPTGWDVTLGLDPRLRQKGLDQNDVFLEYRAEQIFGVSSLRLGPACVALKPYLNDIAVINGVFMSEANVSHEGNLDYMSTGDSSGRASDVTVELAYALATGPLGVLFNDSLKKGRRRLATATTQNLESLRNSVDVSGLAHFLGALPASPLKEAQQSYLASGAVRQRLLDQFQGLQSEFDALSDDQTKRAALVTAAAFASGSCYQAQLEIRADLDTHSGHQGRHLTAQTGAWEQVANLFRLFKSIPAADGQPLFAHTTFAVVSEFARTPALNASGGKDHNPLTNSVLLAGAGVRGGQSLGASQIVGRRQSATGEPRHAASAVNLDTGAIARTAAEGRDPAFGFIYPEHVMATLAEIQGADRTLFSSVRGDVPSLKRVIG